MTDKKDSPECTHDCSTCGESCSSRNSNSKPEDFRAYLREGCTVKKVIGVVSGKGGVGKSLVSALLASGLQKKGLKAAVLDADITGPSIPKVFGINTRAEGNGEAIYPVKSNNGVQIMSINLLLEDVNAPVVWRGPIIAGAVKQFWTDVLWEDVDVMVVDMPPGTGDVPLTVFQSLPVDGIIVVSSPQDLVSMIVKKAVNMAAMMEIPVLGIVENMSYITCPDCGKKIEVFGASHVDEIAKEHGLEVLAKLPINPEFATLCDAGKIEDADVSQLDVAIEKVINLKK